MYTKLVNPHSSKQQYKQNANGKGNNGPCHKYCYDGEYGVHLNQYSDTNIVIKCNLIHLSLKKIAPWRASVAYKTDITKAARLSKRNGSNKYQLQFVTSFALRDSKKNFLR